MSELNAAQVKALKPPAADPKQTQVTEENCVVHPLRIECCCCDNAPRLKTRTIAVDIPAGTPDQVQAQTVAQATVLEANGWLILAHSIVIPGATSGGLKVLLTLGYYA